MHFTQDKMDVEEPQEKGCTKSARVCLKFTLIFMNIPIVIAGAVSFGVGLWVLLDDNSFFGLTADILDLEVLGQDILRQGAIVMMAAGSTMLVLAGLGVVGAITMSSCLLVLYIVPLVVLLTLEVAVIVLAVVFKSEWEGRVHRVLTDKLVSQYGDYLDPSRGPFTRTFNTIQAKLDCCGWESALDYRRVDKFHWNTTMADGLTRHVPDSCCMSNNATWRHECVVSPYNSSSFSTMGCQEAVSIQLKKYQWIVIGVTIAVLVFQFLLLILALMLILHNVNNKYDMS
ncbi:hypothetical protein BsWGS_24517 [Bradybaena similaris]